MVTALLYQKLQLRTGWTSEGNRISRKHNFLKQSNEGYRDLRDERGRELILEVI